MLSLFSAFLFTAPPVATPPPTPPTVVAPQKALDDTPDGDYGGYFTWPEVKAKIAEWKQKYPNLVRESVLGTTLEGRPIPLLRLSDRAEIGPNDAEVLLMAAIHPREQQPQVCLYRFIDEMLAGYGKDARLTKLLKDEQIWVIPIFNVDGKVWDMQHGDGKTKGADWRKNRRPNADGTFGVDLNRNFGVRWGGSREIDPLWKTTTDTPRANIYEGPAPMSEPETRAFAAFVQSRPNLRAFMDIHSPLHEILFPPYGSEEEETRFVKIAKGMHDLQKDKAKYSVGVSHPNADTPPEGRGGNSGLTYTWAYYTHGVYGINFEVGIPVRYPPPGQIQREYQRNVRDPWLFFLDSVRDLRPATPGAVTIATEKASLSSPPVPGTTVTWTPPAVNGPCDWAILVSEGKDIVVASEFRMMPLKRGFTVQVMKDAAPGTTVPLTLYLWDKDRHVSPVHFSLTVAAP